MFNQHCYVKAIERKYLSVWQYLGFNYFFFSPLSQLSKAEWEKKKFDKAIG